MLAQAIDAGVVQRPEAYQDVRITRHIHEQVFHRSV